MTDSGGNSGTNPGKISVREARIDARAALGWPVVHLLSAVCKKTELEIATSLGIPIPGAVCDLALGKMATFRYVVKDQGHLDEFGKKVTLVGDTPLGRVLTATPTPAVRAGILKKVSEYTMHVQQFYKSIYHGGKVKLPNNAEESLAMDVIHGLSIAPGEGPYLSLDIIEAVPIAGPGDDGGGGDGIGVNQNKSPN